MCHLHHNPINLCCVSGLAIPFPTPPLFHQQPVSAEESEKKRGSKEIAQEEHRQLQITIQMFLLLLLLFSAVKGFISVTTCLREVKCIQILKRREKYCVVKCLLPGKQTSNVSMTLGDIVPPRGGIARLLRI